MRTLAAFLVLLVCQVARADEKPSTYLWFEPEWFQGVQGGFNYWTGTDKPTGNWGIAGPGISAEWTQGGESEWNSMGAHAAETTAKCQRDFIVPTSGAYRVWVRYVDHRDASEPFAVALEQNNAAVASGELGAKPIVSPGDEYALYWGFSFAWDVIDAKLVAGPARLALSINKPGQAWRQVDAVLITDDLQYKPYGREKPAFAYRKGFDVHPASPLRGSAGAPANFPVGSSWKRPPLGNRDFTMWTGIEHAKPEWWKLQQVDKLSLYDLFFEASPPYDIRDQFHKQFAGRRDLPIITWPNLRPGLYLGTTPDLSPSTPLRQWLERSKTPFYVMTNYANPTYTGDTGPATYQALTGPLAEQFLGYIHGEAYGTQGVDKPHQQLGATRRAHVDALGKHFVKQQAEVWSKFYKTQVPESHWAKGISCLSTNGQALAHLFRENGTQVVGYEEDATMVNVPLRIAFNRGAARQYGGAWINYASGNFGDACNYFMQNPVVPRGAPGWFHSKYAITDGVSIAWYRKLYYLNFFSGASAIYWEQSLGNQWMLPGPGTHPVQLSPYGRATVDFQSMVDRLPDRGEPFTPVALLLSYGHSYDRVNNECKMLAVFPEDRGDLELRELFNVCWHPVGPLEGNPAAPDVQSMPGSVYGNIFDVLVDRPARASAILDYPVVLATGDVDLSGAWQLMLDEYLKRGGTLVINVENAAKLPAAMLGARLTGTRQGATRWSPDKQAHRDTTPFEVAGVELTTAKPIAWAELQPLAVRNEVGAGAVILTLVPRMLGLDERAHAALPYLLNGLTEGLLPCEVRLAGGGRPQGEFMYQVNKTKDGYVVLLMNCRGIDKTQNGVARVDRRAAVDVVLVPREKIKSATEYTAGEQLKIEPHSGGRQELHVHLPAGDIRVVYVMGT